jgi:hypothetical protein
MLRQQPRIISYSSKTPASAQIGDRHDLIGHHRYYGSSAVQGERRARAPSMSVASEQRKRGGITPAAPNC